MNTCNEVKPSNQNVAPLARRARLESLLFRGARRPGPSFSPIKYPEALGE